MTDGPTTINGPLHTPEADIGDRAMTASFATPAEAQAARQALIDAGIAADRITLAEHAAESPAVQEAMRPADSGSIVGRIREAILPDDSQTGTRDAARNDDAILNVRPSKEEVETAVRVLEAAKPRMFDADLERWRNAG